MRDLNRVVFAAEAIEVPRLPELDVEHAWKHSPASFENGEERTLEESEALGLAWQLLAVKLYECLQEIDLDEHTEELSALREKAKAARLALIRLEGYDPPPPGAP